MNLFSELKRRNVFKVAAAYVVMGWVLVQVASTIQPMMNLPDWSGPLVLYLLIIGFPLALFFSWAFEMTPEGIRRTEDVDPSQSVTPQTGKKIEYLIIAGLMIAVSFLLIENGNQDTPTEYIAQEGVIPTIAVLPFSDMSAKGDQEYFGDGIAEELLNVLVRIEGLKVTSRTSSFAFKGQEGRSISEIGEALNVGHILEGSVRTSGNTVRITAQLIDVKTDTHLWSETYDRNIENIFAIQDEISDAIVEALKVELGTEDEAMVTPSTSSIEAYNLYLRGKFEFAKRLGTEYQFVLDAINLFEAATIIDPDFTDAFAILALAQAMAVNYGPDEVFRNHMNLSKQAMTHALEQDPENVDALLTKAIIQYQFDGDFEGAEETFKKITVLSPNDAEIFNFYGDYLTIVMDYENANKIEWRAVELDPTSVLNKVEYGAGLTMSGRTDEGLEYLEKVVLDNPDVPWAWRTLAMGHYYAGDRERGLELGRQGYEKWPDNFAFHSLVLFFGLEGTIEDFPEESKISDFDKAYYYYKNGDYDNSYKFLNRVYEKGLNYFFLNSWPIYDPKEWEFHEGLKEFFQRPGLKELMEIRQKNMGYVKD